MLVLYECEMAKSACNCTSAFNFLITKLCRTVELQYFTLKISQQRQATTITLYLALTTFLVEEVAVGYIITDFAKLCN